MDAISEALAGRKRPMKYWFRYWITDRNGTRTAEITEHVLNASISCDNDRDCVRILNIQIRATDLITPFVDHIQPVMYLSTYQNLPPGELTEVVEEFPLGVFATDFAKRTVGSNGDTLSFVCNDMCIHLIESTVISETVNEQQRVAIPDRITGGTFTLTFDGQTTGAITHPATAATVTTALEALSNVASGDVVVTGVQGGPYVITFTNNLGGRGVPQMTGNPTNLTPAARNPAVNISTIRQGGLGAGYTITSGTDYALEAVADILEKQGFSPLRLALPANTENTPQDFTSPPGTTWLKIINDLLDGINCHHLWFDNYGFATSRPREVMAEEQGDVLYESDQNSIVIGEPEIEDSREAVYNQVVCMSGDPSYPQVTVTVTNNNPASPYSTINLGRVIALPEPKEFPRVFDVTILENRCKAELEKVSAVNGQIVRFGTVLDPRRKPHEYYKLNLYAGTNEIQRLAISGTPTGGTFTLTLDDETTDSIIFNATPAMIEGELEELINIGIGGVRVWGGPLPDYAIMIEFIGERSAQNMQLLGATSSLTGGSSPAITITELQRGVSKGSRIEGVYRVISWTMPLRVGGIMTHEVGKVDEVLDD